MMSPSSEIILNLLIALTSSASRASFTSRYISATSCPKQLISNDLYHPKGEKYELYPLSSKIVAIVGQTSMELDSWLKNLLKCAHGYTKTLSTLYLEGSRTNSFSSLGVFVEGSTF